MIIVHKENYGAVYTVDEDSLELYYAPIYANNTVNLSEFAPVDALALELEDDLLVIQEQLIHLVKHHYETNS